MPGAIEQGRGANADGTLRSHPRRDHAGPQALHRQGAIAAMVPTYTWTRTADGYTNFRQGRRRARITFGRTSSFEKAES
jgi:hypothetical protein